MKLSESSKVMQTMDLVMCPTDRLFGSNHCHSSRVLCGPSTSSTLFGPQHRPRALARRPSAEFLQSDNLEHLCGRYATSCIVLVSSPLLLSRVSVLVAERRRLSLGGSWFSQAKTDGPWYRLYPFEVVQTRGSDRKTPLGGPSVGHIQRAFRKA